VKAKTKILISSIILSLTTIVLLYSFYGCSQKSARSVDSSSISTESAQKRQDVSEAESDVQSQQVLVESEKETLKDGPAKPTFIGTPRNPQPQVVNQVSAPQDVKLSLKPESQEIPGMVLRGPVLDEEKLVENGTRNGKYSETVTYGRVDRFSPTYGGGMRGGMDGMGE